MGELGDRVAIITGAGTTAEGVGVGAAIALTLARAGASIVVVDNSAIRARETQSMIVGEGGRAVACIGDIGFVDVCRTAVEQTVEVFGRVDVLVNNVALSGQGTVVSLPDEDWSRLVAVNLMSAVRMSRFAVPAMERQQKGSIINISSVASTVGLGSAAYSATKGALNALTRDMAVSHGRAGIRVNAILPGHLNTPRVANLRGADRNSAQRMMGDQALRNAANPLGVEGSAWDVAWAAEYLASDRSAFVTGVLLPVDGGVLATSYMSMEPIIRTDSRN